MLKLISVGSEDAYYEQRALLEGKLFEKVSDNHYDCVDKDVHVEGHADGTPFCFWSVKFEEVKG